MGLPAVGRRRNTTRIGPDQGHSRGMSTVSHGTPRKPDVTLRAESDITKLNIASGIDIEACTKGVIITTLSAQERTSHEGCFDRGLATHDVEIVAAQCSQSHHRRNRWFTIRQWT